MHGERLFAPQMTSTCSSVLDYSKHGSDYYSTYDSVQKVLERFHSILKDCYPGTPIRKDHPAIHLAFATYGFDVVPAFHRNGGGYVIPKPCWKWLDFHGSNQTCGSERRL